MDARKVVKYVAVVAGAVVALSLVQENPVQIGLLAVFAGGWFWGDNRI